MGIVIIRRPREATDKKTGLGRYADSIEVLLDGFPAGHGLVEAEIDLKHGLARAILDGLVRPFLRVLRTCRDRDGIVHATDELCGVFFPFVRGRRILTVHHVITPSEGRGGTYERLWFAMTRMAVRHSDEIIAISPDTARDVIDTFSPDAEVHIVFNSVSDLYRRDESVQREKLVGVVAELIPRKNVMESVEAFRILSSMEGMGDCRMVICGDGPERDDISRRVAEAGLSDRVEMVKSLEDGELLALYNRMSLLFNTSLHEGVGMVTLEANRCGTPALCLERARIPPEVTEASVKCRDAEEMAAEAARLLSDSREYARVSELSEEVSSRFGEGFADSMRRLYGLS